MRFALLLSVTLGTTLLATLAAAQGDDGRGSSMRRDVPRIRQMPVTVGPSLSKEAIRRVVRAHRSDLRRCHEALLAREPDAEGRVVVEFRIPPGGRVRQARVTESDLDAETRRCIVAALRRWRFPDLNTGGVVVVRYPFVLRRP